jgi:hypothetical protein
MPGFDAVIFYSVWRVGKFHIFGDRRQETETGGRR